MNKRGDVYNMLYGMVILFILAVTILIASKVIGNVSSNLSGKLGTTGEGILTASQSAITGLNYLFIFIFAGITIALLVGAFLIKTHPIFFFALSFIFFLILIILSAQFSNIYESISTSSQLSSEADSFGVQNYIMAHLPLFELIVYVSVSILFYAKTKYE